MPPEASEVITTGTTVLMEAVDSPVETPGITPLQAVSRTVRVKEMIKIVFIGLREVTVIMDARSVDPVPGLEPDLGM